MKMICKIAKNELRNLFYSPVAWFLAIAFLVQCAIFFTGPVAGIAKYQELLIKNSPSFKNFGAFSLTNAIFLGQDGIFANALQNLFLFVPLLCMGLISREINNGTIKLLYSSPVKVRDIVLGKYLAIMLYNVMLVLIMGIFMVCGAIQIKSVDYGLLLSATLGFYLLVCAYTAIGLFMSALTTYQIVSAIGSFITIFALGRIGGLWQKIDFVRDLTYFLSISGRTNSMIKGLITSKDVLYFILIVYMFVAFTYLKLKGDRESKPWYRKASGYVLVMAATLLIGYATSRPATTLYWDTTAQQVNTIHPNTQKIVKELGKDELEVTLYCNLLGKGSLMGFPEGRNAYLSGLWEPYVRFKPDITFKYVYYYDNDVTKDDSAYYKMYPGKTLKQIAKMMSDGYDADFSRFVPGEEIRKTIDLRPEDLRLVMQLKYKGHTTFLRTFDDNIFWPQEQQVSAAFKRLLQAEMPKVCYITGDLERDINKRGEREFRLHSTDKGNRAALINVGFDVDTVNLSTQEIPAGITALVLADPKMDLSAVVRAKIQQYIDRGGNMLIEGKPGKQYVLNPVLAPLGVQLMNGNLVEPSKEEMPHMVKPYATVAAGKLADEQRLIDWREKGDTVRTLMPGVTGISYDAHGPFIVTPLLMSQELRTWQKAGVLVTDSVPPVFNAQEGDLRGPFPTCVALTRQLNGHEQRIVVTGDADFMSNLRMGGGFFSRAVFSWLDENKFPIYSPIKEPADNLLRLSESGSKICRIFFVWILPALVLLLGVITLIRRKRK